MVYSVSVREVVPAIRKKCVGGVWEWIMHKTINAVPIVLESGKVFLKSHFFDVRQLTILVKEVMGYMADQKMIF